MLYMFIMFCKSNVDMFLHSKLSAHESESPFVVHVAYDISKRSPQPVLELSSSSTALKRLLPQLSVASVACDAVRYICGR